MKRTLVTLGMLFLIWLTRNRRSGTVLAVLGTMYLQKMWYAPGTNARPPLWARAGSRRLLGPGAIDGHRRRRQLI